MSIFLKQLCVPSIAGTLLLMIPPSVFLVAGCAKKTIACFDEVYGNSLFWKIFGGEFLFLLVVSFINKVVFSNIKNKLALIYVIALTSTLECVFMTILIHPVPLADGIEAGLLIETLPIITVSIISWFVREKTTQKSFG